jgi:hypothetical protein
MVGQLTWPASPTRGSFGGAVIAGVHDGDPHRLLSCEPIFGLVRDSTYLFANLRDAEGQMYSVMRRHRGAPVSPNRLWVRSSLGGNGLDRHDLPDRSALARRIVGVADGASARLTANRGNGDGDGDRDNHGEQPMDCCVTPHGIAWSEGAILQLDGTDVSPAWQWYLPDAAGSMLYASRLFVVEGRFGDTPVRGIAGVEDVFLDVGRQNYVDDPITDRHRSTAWCTWATVFDDGSAESGHVAFGPDRFGFAMRSCADGTIDIGTSVDGSVTMSDEGLPVSATFMIDGVSWAFDVDRHGRCAPLGGPVLQAEGLFTRVGETRRPIVWSASLEVPVPTQVST